MSRSNSCKRYCFTLNNYIDEEYQRLLRILKDIAVYFIIGKEIGNQGTPHLQGYFILRTKDRITALRNKLTERAHFEVSRGTPIDNRVYCSKEGNYEEFGSCPTNGCSGEKRKNRDELAIEWNTAMESGRSGLDKFAVDNPGTYAWSRFTLLRNSLGHARALSRPSISVEWYYGEPGVGKSRRAHEKFPDAYIKDPRTKWWNGYLLEKECIIDDFGPNGIDINHLLRWFDRYKCYVEVKGDMCPLYVESFIVTSNFTPEEVFTCNLGIVHKQLPALLRRINIINF